jgi:hypothetical protein
MTNIAAVQTYIKTYAGLKTGKPVWVDYLGTVPTEYGIVPLPGGGIIERYMSGSSLREFLFAFQSAESTAADLDRLANIGFYEAFADWLEQQTKNKNFPALGNGKTPEKIEAVTGGYLFEQGDSDTGIYQINCRLEYYQAAQADDESE